VARSGHAGCCGVGIPTRGWRRQLDLGARTAAATGSVHARVAASSSRRMSRCTPYAAPMHRSGPCSLRRGDAPRRTSSLPWGRRRRFIRIFVFRSAPPARVLNPLYSSLRRMGFRSLLTGVRVWYSGGAASGVRGRRRRGPCQRRPSYHHHAFASSRSGSCAHAEVTDEEVEILKSSSASIIELITFLHKHRCSLL
jgi:hypothetical protein